MSDLLLQSVGLVGVALEPLMGFVVSPAFGGSRGMALEDAIDALTVDNVKSLGLPQLQARKLQVALETAKSRLADGVPIIASLGTVPLSATAVPVVRT
jgi:hypothetical protein